MRDNIQKDIDEECEFYKVILENLHPWLNPQMYRELEKRKEAKRLLKVSGAYKDFIADIAKHTKDTAFVKKLQDKYG